MKRSNMHRQAEPAHDHAATAPEITERPRGEARACGAPCVAGRVCALSEREHQAGPSVGSESPNAGRTGVGAPPHRGTAAAPDRERAAGRGNGSAAPASTPSRATAGNCQLVLTVAVWWQFPGMTSPPQSCEAQIFQESPLVSTPVLRWLCFTRTN